MFEPIIFQKKKIGTKVLSILKSGGVYVWKTLESMKGPILMFVKIRHFRPKPCYKSLLEVDTKDLVVTTVEFGLQVGGFENNNNKIRRKRYTGRHQ